MSKQIKNLSIIINIDGDTGKPISGITNYHVTETDKKIKPQYIDDIDFNKTVTQFTIEVLKKVKKEEKIS